MKSRLSRGILVLHRYMGVAVGLLMTVWCLSGFVMMYQSFPATSDAERRASLPKLDLSGPLALESLPISGDEEIRRFRVEMLGDTPVLRMGGGRGGGGGSGAYDLRTGQELGELGRDEVTAVARRHAAGNGLDFSGAAAPRLMDSVDQWTIQSFKSAQPLYVVELRDSAATELYVSGASGTVVQDTDRTERVLSWLGAIPHWLYPTLLRQNGPLWTEVVIWTSVLGTFLTITGLYVGIGRFTRRNGRISPYRGLWYWHHMLGLGLGVLTLTWVFSGLLTMGPWGLMSGGRTDVRQQLTGTATWAQAREMLEQAARNGLPAGTVQVSPTTLGGRLFALAQAGDGSVTRLDRQARPAPVTAGEVRAVLGELPVARLEHMTGEDTYYYSFKDREAPPAYRAILRDEQSTRIYIDANTGEVARVIDNAARESRWLRGGMHSLDFIRGRPLWDILTILLLAGVTAVCATGTWMSFRRVGRDFKMLRRGRRKKTAPAGSRGAPAGQSAL